MGNEAANGKANGVAVQPPHSVNDMARIFTVFLDRQQAMCSELEAMADALPNDIDQKSSLKTTSEMLVLMKNAHEFEENELFPALLRVVDTSPSLEQSIERLLYEHFGDEDFAENIHNTIKAYVANIDRSKAESLSWMLRGFFENIRRHIAFEREHILPLAATLGKSAA